MLFRCLFDKLPFELGRDSEVQSFFFRHGHLISGLHLFMMDKRSRKSRAQALHGICATPRAPLPTGTKTDSLTSPRPTRKRSRS
jgi:hypothetical protein